MYRTKLLLLLVICASQLTGCMSTLKVLSAIGEAQQQQQQNTGSQSTLPNYYPTYSAPQVVTPQLSSPNVVHCRTIGYITTCQ